MHAAEALTLSWMTECAEMLCPAACRPYGHTRQYNSRRGTRPTRGRHPAVTRPTRDGHFNSSHTYGLQDIECQKSHGAYTFPTATCGGNIHV
ncbi:jg15597 [Pararge aegeria aegeria]|uniref:Jg15597 protein n=1 Tax=Pararge aegeria aegeria TaxID=348720 RepID=A0A8S4RU70_9NEOP|nr:jg15597 [Pararge aegeria aegeria]